MGDTLSQEQKQNFENKLHFVEVTEDPNFGQIEISRFKEPPYQYIMKFEKKFIYGDHRLDDYVGSLNKMRDNDHKNFAKIHLIDQKVQSHMCIKDQKVYAFCNYYNFTVKQAIDRKKYKQTRFNEQQLVYTFWCLLDLALYLKKRGISFGDYRSNKVFLSPQGYIKVYLLGLGTDNRHTSYYQALISRSEIEQLILSPQQLYKLSQMDTEPNINLYKADIFRIGMIIIQMLTLDQIKFYYNQQRTAYKMGRINFELSSFASQYSNQFLQLLRTCLRQSSNDRCTIEQALTRVEQIRKNSSNISYCLKLNDEDDESKKRKPLMSVKGQYILSGIEKRLAPVPIKSMVSSGYNTKRNKQQERP